MIKININDNYIKEQLKEIDNKLSVIQIIILVLCTVLISFGIIFYTYITLISIITISGAAFILFVIYVIIEMKRNNLAEQWYIKEAKIELDKKNTKILDKYNIKLKDVKGKCQIPYEEYHDLNKDSIGYAVIGKKQKKVLLWFDKKKYDYENK